ncbi:MAG: Phosphoribosylformylglycinamidine synthase, partial [Flavisolibacter sp.]|nr:Phosphoribosylformylglycinamidine synthase [Flavisolibacter sp.]
SANAMCSHKINLADIKDIDKEVIEWLKAAYDNAG